MENQLRREDPSSQNPQTTRPYELTLRERQNRERDYRADERARHGDNIAFMKSYVRPTTLQRETDADRRYHTLLAQGYGVGGRKREKTRSKMRGRTRTKTRRRTRGRTRSRSRGRTRNTR